MFSGKITPPEPFSLGLTLLCGQCFRWEGPSYAGASGGKPDAAGWFQGVAGQAFWRLRQQSGRLDWECGSETVRGVPAGEWLSRYLNLDVDLQERLSLLETHPVMGRSVKLLRGLRLLRQEPWECAVSYMFAQGLSVRIIQQALAKFCRQYGRPLPEVPGFHAFPEPRDLADLTPDFLRPFTNNYRARADRIIRMARAVEAKVISLEHLKEIPCDDAREALMALDGIGPKIADCILLFSMDQPSAFPVDRWVLRAMKRHFHSVKLLGGGEEAPTRHRYLKIVRKARAAFGEDCGIASEYLFLFLRLLEDEKLRLELLPFCQTPDSFWGVEARPGRSRPKNGGSRLRSSL